LPEETPVDFDEIVESIRLKDNRYQPDAFQFVREALDYRVTRLENRRHISGRELLEGVRQLALERYGPMARSVLNHWGVNVGEDVGNIVFHLVDAGVMSKTDQDSMADFSGVIRFDAQFESDYRWY
jgi:uncharacterized repeat protein (TIGR04138 family)